MTKFKLLFLFSINRRISSDFSQHSNDRGRIIRPTGMDVGLKDIDLEDNDRAAGGHPSIRKEIHLITVAI